MRDVLHLVLLRATQLLLLPVLIGCWIEQACFSAERWFGFWAESFSLVPDFPGSLVRKAYYAGALRDCAARAYIGFGAVIGHRDASIGRAVSIGRYALIGCAQIGAGAQIASRVSITSGRRQHDLVAEPNAPVWLERVSIGADAWIGEGAIVMADVGRGSVVGAGSVVTRPVADGAVVAGNPARELNAGVRRTASMEGVLLRSHDRPAAAPPRAWRGRAALMGGGVLIALLALEVTARILLPAPLPWNQPQVRYASDPELGFRMAPAQQGFTADKPVTVNERGLRGALVPWQRDAKRPRVVLLGDSIVFGYGVNEDQAVGSALAELMAARGTAIEVVNAGVPAYSTDQEIAWLEREGLRYRPDWVVVGFCWNDIGDKRGVTVSPNGDLISEGANDTGGRESVGGASVRNALKRSRLLYVAAEGARQLYRRWSPPDLSSALRQAVLDDRPMPQVEAGWDRVAASLRRLRELADRHQFRPLVMAFPIPVALDGGFPRSSYPGRLRAIAADAGLPFLDLSPIFQAVYRGHESLFIPYDGDHPNAAGHRIAAEALAGFLSADTAQLAVAPSAAGAAQTRGDDTR